MKISVALAAAVLCGLSLSLPARGEDTPAPAPAPAAAANGETDLRRVETIDVKPGDRWVYDVVDDITGEAEGTLAYVVTEIVDGTMSVQTTRDPGNGRPSGTALQVYDLDWNLLEDSIWKRTPGTPVSGIVRPLEATSHWETTYKATKKPDLVVKVAAASEVKGIEDVVLRFNKTYRAFKIETTERSSGPDGTKFTLTSTIWYAPAVDRYVKKVMENRTNGRLTARSVETLRAYTRRKTTE